MISKSLGTSRKFFSLFAAVPALAEFCQSLYPLIVSHCDDFGRMQGDPLTVKLQCHPGSPRSIEDFGLALEALSVAGLLRLYVVDDQSYLQITKFDPHQQGLHKRTESAFPPIPGYSENAGKLPERAERVREIPSELNRTELKRSEQNGTALARSRLSTVLEGSLPREHRDHALCDDTFSRCIPAPVHRKLTNALAPKYGGDREQAAAALLAWYPTVWSSLSADHVIGDAFKFWQARFDAAFVAAVHASRPDEPRRVVPDADETQRHIDELKKWGAK